jgi:hypothetical protein
LKSGTGGKRERKVGDRALTLFHTYIYEEEKDDDTSIGSVSRYRSASFHRVGGEGT